MRLRDLRASTSGIAPAPCTGGTGRARCPRAGPSRACARSGSVRRSTSRSPPGTRRRPATSSSSYMAGPHLRGWARSDVWFASVSGVSCAPFGRIRRARCSTLGAVTDFPAVKLHVVSGKGGTGKTTVAASLALALAAGGRQVLLTEVEGRQGIAQLFDTPPLPYEERRVAVAQRRRRGLRPRDRSGAGAAGVPRAVLQPAARRLDAEEARRDRLRHDDRTRGCATSCSPAR